MNYAPMYLRGHVCAPLECNSLLSVLPEFCGRGLSFASKQGASGNEHHGMSYKVAHCGFEHEIHN